MCLGDFNVDMLCPDDYNTVHLLDLARHFSLVQFIDSPTRVTRTTATIIDLILASSDLRSADSGVADSMDISDHLMVYATLVVPRPASRCRISMSHDLHSVQSNELDLLLYSIDWVPLYAAPHVDVGVSYFTTSILSVFDCLAPIKHKRVSRPRAP